MKSTDTHYLKYLLGGIVIAGALWYFTGSWPIALAFLSAVVLCKLVEMIIDLFEARAFGKLIQNISSPHKGSLKSYRVPEFFKNIISKVFQLVKRFFMKQPLSTKEYFQLYFVFTFSVFLLVLLVSTPAIALEVLGFFMAIIVCILFIAGLHYLIGFIFPKTI